MRARLHGFSVCAPLLCVLAVSITPSLAQPNIPYAGPYPAGIRKLAASNPLLAQEIGKLPEMQDGISAAEGEALERLVRVRDEDPARFDAMFERMNAVGKPQVRKFAAPLQAYFWLALDGKEARLRQLRDNYALESLLNETWRPGLEAARMAVAGKPGAPADPRRLEGLSRRWRDFSETVDRLSAPRLVHYYARYALRYQKERLDADQTPEETFARAGGVCRHFSAFAVYALERAGYRARNLTFAWGTGREEGHAVAVVHADDGSYRVVVDTAALNKKSRDYPGYAEIIDDLAGDRHVVFWAAETNDQMRVRSAGR